MSTKSGNKGEHPTLYLGRTGGGRREWLDVLPEGLGLEGVRLGWVEPGEPAHSIVTLPGSSRAKRKVAVK